VPNVKLDPHYPVIQRLMLHWLS